jgi:hypothetical protein
MLPVLYPHLSTSGGPHTQLVRGDHNFCIAIPPRRGGYIYVGSPGQFELLCMHRRCETTETHPGKFDNAQVNSSERQQICTKDSFTLKLFDEVWMGSFTVSEIFQIANCGEVWL